MCKYFECGEKKRADERTAGVDLNFRASRRAAREKKGGEKRREQSVEDEGGS